HVTGTPYRHLDWRGYRGPSRRNPARPGTDAEADLAGDAVPQPGPVGERADDSAAVDPTGGPAGPAPVEVDRAGRAGPAGTGDLLRRSGPGASAADGGGGRGDPGALRRAVVHGRVRADVARAGGQLPAGVPARF